MMPSKVPPKDPSLFSDSIFFLNASTSAFLSESEKVSVAVFKTDGTRVQPWFMPLKIHQLKLLSYYRLETWRPFKMELLKYSGGRKVVILNLGRFSIFEKFDLQPRFKKVLFKIQLKKTSPSWSTSFPSITGRITHKSPFESPMSRGGQRRSLHWAQL